MAFVKVNISGRKYEIRRRTLKRYPKTLLGVLANCEDGFKAKRDLLCDEYLPETEEFFFERSPRLFEIIIKYYQSRHVHHMGVCPLELMEELVFWGIDALNKQCEFCEGELPEGDEQSENMDLEEKEGSALNADGAAQGIFRKASERVKDFQRRKKIGHRSDVSKWGQVQSSIWDVLESGQQEGKKMSVLGFIYTALTVAFIVATVVVIILGSMRKYQTIECVKQSEEGVCLKESREPISALEVADTIIVIWFTLDYIIHLIAAPNAWTFIWEPLSIIDFLSIAPYYVDLCITSGDTGSAYKLRKSALAGRVLRVLRLCRAIRVLKLAKYLKQVNILGDAVRRSISELIMITFAVLLTSFLFATTMYYMEMDAIDTEYSNILITTWWAIASGFTFAFVEPQSIGGRITATISYVAGILMLAFPVTILINKFSQVSRERRRDEEKEERNKIMKQLQEKKQSELMKRRWSHAPAQAVQDIDDDEDHNE